MSESPTEAFRTWERLYQQGLAHARANELEEALLAHRSALALCDHGNSTDDNDLPRASHLRYVVLGSLGYVYRMLGRLGSASECLEEAVRNLPRGDPGRLKALGKLAVVYRHFERLDDAKRTCEEQYEVAREMGLEHEMERAVGNLGMVNYQLFLVNRDMAYLELAITQLDERIERCRKLRTGVEIPGDARDRAARVQSATAREAIAFARLSLCYTAQGDRGKAIEAARERQALSFQSKDPSKIAFSRFFLGRALFLDGRKEDAIDQLNPSDGYTPVAALSKEPCEEYRGYISEMIAAGADVTLRDKTGYSALDYAVYNGDELTQNILIQALRRQLDHLEVEQHCVESTLRKGHRELFQDILRPVLLQPDKKTSVKQLRRAYAETLASDKEKAKLFDRFKYVRFTDFARCGKLPKGTDNWTRCFGDDADDDLFVIFMSYTWAKKNPNSAGEICPDDEENTRYHQMISGVESFLEENPDVDPATVCIWLDWACIDQVDREVQARGVSALPISLAQCNAMISITNQDYYERAWCCVEVITIRALQRSYGAHRWHEYEHDCVQQKMVLRDGSLDMVLSVAAANVSFESDRPKLTFLERQARLLDNGASVQFEHIGLA